MRLHFQEKPWDLFVAEGYAAVVVVALLSLSFGNPLAILLVLFVPGYVLVAALFPNSLAPEKPEIEWIERIALSAGLSIAVVPMLGLLLNFTPWGIRFYPIVVTIALFTGGVGYAAYWRRMRLPPDQRLGLSMELGFPDWTEYTVVEKGLALALSAGIVIAGGTLAYAILTPRTGKTFTEFYILGAGDNASGYSTALNVSQPGTVIVGLTNHESASVNYTLRVDLAGVRMVHNATSGLNEIIEVNRTTRSMVNISLTDGSDWTQSYTFQINSTGLWEVRFLLFKDDDFSSPYRELYLIVRVQ